MSSSLDSIVKNNTQQCREEGSEGLADKMHEISTNASSNTLPKVAGNVVDEELEDGKYTGEVVEAIIDVYSDDSHSHEDNDDYSNLTIESGGAKKDVNNYGSSDHLRTPAVLDKTVVDYSNPAYDSLGVKYSEEEQVFMNRLQLCYQYRYINTAGTLSPTTPSRRRHPNGIDYNALKAMN